MALSVKNPEADALARELTAVTGESMTEAVIVALRERLDRVRGGRSAAITRRLHALKAETSEYEGADVRSAEAIIGYDEHGLPE